MEPLLAQLKSLPQRFTTMSRAARLGALAALAAALAIGAGVYLAAGGSESYQYAFTNLSPEDGQAAASVLKGAGVPFRSEAGGSAIAVPANKVYDARLLLAAQGLPRAGGVGFELFDKGQFGVSEFTQRVNLRRAIEGELSRTIGSLAEVRAARVHLSMGERGLYRDEDKAATASVAVTLQSGRTLSADQLSGIRHLVSSAVPGLSPDAVTVVDGHGAVLGGAATEQLQGRAFEAQLEASLQQRVVGLLEPVVGAGAVVARVSVLADSSEVDQQAEVFDPDATALRMEKKTTSQQSNENGTSGGVAGAQANVPLAFAQPSGGTTSKSGNSSQDEQRTFEISKTNTTTRIKSPRLRRLSVAVLLDAPAGKTRDEAELSRLTELTKKAIGFDEQRGDQLQLSQATFARADLAPEVAQPKPELPFWAPYAAAGLGAFLLLALVAATLRRGKKTEAPLVLKPGMKISELEAVSATAAAAPLDALAAGAKKLPEPAKVQVVVPPAALPSPEALLREKAVEHARKDPTKTAQLIRAWIAADTEAAKEARRA